MQSRPLAKSLIVLASLMWTGCDLLQPQPPTGAQAVFDEVWNTFDQKYSYFNVKGIDWNAIRTAHRPSFAQSLTADQFAEKIATVLAELRDLHVNVEKPNGTAVEVFVKPWVQNYPSTPRNRYTTSGYSVIGNNVVFHAWVGSGAIRNIGYIRVDTLDTNAFASISESDIDDLFEAYENADGMILDIRPNNGGNENMAARFASHFTNQPRIYGYYAYRNGPAHDDFDPIETRTLNPAASHRFLGPVACLIGPRCLSSAESFALMMRACPNVALIGATTRGGSGAPEWFTASNGVRYSVSRWIAYDADLLEIEDKGVSPDPGFAIAPDDSIDGEHDYVLEAALDALES